MPGNRILQFLMKHLAVFLACLLGFGGLFLYLLWGRGGPVLVWGGAAAGALGSIIFISGVLTLLKSWRLRKAFARTRSGRRPVDGQLTVVEGVVTTRGEALQAPLSGKPCLAYEYEVSRMKSRSGRARAGDSSEPVKETAACGIGATRLIMRTSLGEFALDGVPILERFENEAITDTAGRQRTQHFLAAGEFERLSLFNTLKMIDQLVSLVSGEKGNGRLDWKIDGEIDLDDGRWLASEKRIEPDQHVTVVGDFDSRNRSLKPGNSSTDTFDILPGTLTEARSLLLVSQLVTTVVSGAIGAVMIGGALLAIILAGPPVSAGALPFKNQPLRKAVEHGDPVIVKELVEAGADPNEKDTFGSPLIFDTRDPDMIQALLDSGATSQMTDHKGFSRLFYAALRGEPKIARLLIDGGADIESRTSEEYGSETPLAAAIREGHEEIATMLREAGAVDNRVTAETGTALDSSSEAFQVVFDYLSTLQQRDLEAAASFWESSTDQSRLAGADPEILANSRPADPELIKGFESGDDATIRVAGNTNYGRLAWNYQLHRTGDVWRLTREWETK